MAEPIPRRFVANACNLELDDAVRCVPIEHANLFAGHSTLKLHPHGTHDALMLVRRVASTADDVRCPATRRVNGHGDTYRRRVVIVWSIAARWCRPPPHCSRKVRLPVRPIVDGRSGATHDRTIGPDVEH